MSWLTGSGYAHWSAGLLATAAQGCARTWLLLCLGLTVVVATGWALSRSRLGPRAVLLLSAVTAGGLAWIARDQNLLLGDSRVWIQQAEATGWQLPAYRAPLSALVYSGLGRLVGDTLSVTTTLALVSVLGGLGTAWAIWLGVRDEGPHRRIPAGYVVPALFCAPLAFGFFGHVETYPFFLFALAAFFAVLKRELDRGGPFFISVMAFVVLVFVHYSALLLAVPLVTVALAHRRPRRVGPGLLYPLLCAGAGAVAMLLPPSRTYTLLGGDWPGMSLVDYLWDVVNMWALVLVPLGIVALAWRRRIARDPFGRIVLLSALTFALFPLLGYFALGGYRDLDLMGPVHVCLVLATALAVARAGRPWSGRLAGVLLAGAIWLAALQTLALCPAGARELERHLDRRAMDNEGRAGGEETLAFYYREQDDLPRARDRMLRAVAAMPGNLRLWGPVGEIQLAQGDTAAAVASLRRAMDSPRAPRTAPRLGELLTRQGREREAIEVLESVREDVMRTSRGSAALAVAYYRAGLPDSALAVASARIAIDPEDDVAYFNAAAALARLGDLEGAATALGRAAALAPDDGRHHRQLVRIYLSLPEGEERARRHLESLDPALADSIRAGF